MAKESRSAAKDVKGAMHRKKRGTLKSVPQRKEGDEQKTGDCDRPFRSTSQRQESSGPQEEGVLVGASDCRADPFAHELVR